MRTTIIVAGGSGKRMASDIPKQFLPVNGKPVLMYTLKCFADFDSGMKLILALPAEQTERWQQLCAEHKFTIPHTLVHGGITRFHSVRNALAAADDKGLIAVHDGVRPFVAHEVIARCFNEAESSGAAIPVLVPVDSLRHVTNNESVAVDRNMYRIVQTPQVFDAALIKAAYADCGDLHEFTDDASLVEHFGRRIALVEGNRENIKITTPFDLTMAEIIIKKQEETRIG